MYMYILFHIVFHYGSLLDFEYSSLYSRTVCSIVYLLITNSNLITPSLTLFCFSNHKYVFYVFKSTSVV